MIKYVEADNLWRIYWSETMELADPRWFASLKEAGPVARDLAFPAESEPASE